MPQQSAIEIEACAVTDTSSIIVPPEALANRRNHSAFSLDDVLSRRSTSRAMPRGPAAHTTSDHFKSQSCFSKPKSKRWDHRINVESASRRSSSLRAAAAYLTRPGTISLGGGLPSSDYFPFEELSVKIPVPPQFSEAQTKLSGQTVRTGKHDIGLGSSLYDLSVALNYGQATGSAQLLRFVTEHTEIVHNPPYSDWECCLSSGSTAALETAFRMFCTRGEYMLAEEYTFSTAIETATPLGIKIQGIKMDTQGLLPSDLDHVLSTWDVSERQAPKPFLLYTVPTGQNPTGATQGLERRKAIYAVAEKHDIYILEDEPYYFLQMEPYTTNSTNPYTANEATTEGPQDQRQPHRATTPTTKFLSALVPSYLHLDTSGRVLRLDSFSKITAPGTRSGWLTASGQVVERFLHHHEVTTQNPSGFSQIVLFKLLDEAWGHRGFLEWLMFLRQEYTRRRDVIVRAAERFLPREVCSWVEPAAGMYFWIRVDWGRHPSVRDERERESERAPEQILEIEDAVFQAGITEGVLCCKGSWFRAQQGTGREMFFRMTFAAAAEGKMEEAVKRFGIAIQREFGL